MDVLKLAEMTGLREGVAKGLGEVLSESEYQMYRREYEEAKEPGHADFFRQVLGQSLDGRFFLAFFCRMACDVYEKYQEKGIPEDVFRDTFSDIRFWCENCEREYGAYAIRQYDWFWRLMDMRLFRLGRLEYEEMDSEWNLCGQGIRIKKGDAVINIHIPQGEPLHWAACEESLEKAYEWFGKERQYICHSWLLYPGLAHVLLPESNIMKFQKQFTILEVDHEDREAEWRIFGKVQNNPSLYEEHTSLQKRAKTHLLEGKKMGTGIGVLAV